MAHHDGTEKSASRIARVGKRKWGYDADQVDAFLERAHALYESEDAKLTQQDIQNVSFDLSKGGYDITQVDAALSRLEQAVVDKQTTREITDHGRVAWKAQTEELYRQVCEHADRDAGERFARGRDRKPSYDRKQVDRLVDQIVDKAALELGADGAGDKDSRKLDEVNSSFVSNIVFTQRKGKRGYDERQVDFYLNSCVQLLSRLESFARVADYVSGVHEPVQSSSPANGVTPLFGSGNAYAPMPQQNVHADDAMPQSFAPAIQPASAQSGESFHALHQAEEALFASPSAAGVQEAGQPVSSLAALARTVGQSAGQTGNHPENSSDAESAQDVSAQVPVAPAVPAPAQPSGAVLSALSPAASTSAAPAVQQFASGGQTGSVESAPAAAPAAAASESMPVSFPPASNRQDIRQDDVKPGEVTAAFDPLAALDDEEVRTQAEPSHVRTSVPAAVPVPVPVNVPAAPVQAVPQGSAQSGFAQPDSKSDIPSDLFSGLVFNPESKSDFDIPDLSFPTLNTGDSQSDLFAHAQASRKSGGEPDEAQSASR